MERRVEMGKHYAMGLWDMKTMFRCCLLMFFLGGLATLRFYRKNNEDLAVISSKVEVTHPPVATNKNTSTLVFDDQRTLKIAPPFLTDSCDLFSGRWVYDNKSHYPLYKEHECPYLNGDLACQTHGRKDSKYQQWRWQPHGCDFPRFDGEAVVKRLRGKRLLFVGDSINRNQWDSMICMLQSFIPGKKEVKQPGVNGTVIYSFRAADYNISVDLYWAPMLVESNGDDPSNHRAHLRVIRSQDIEKHARHWVDADVIIFNSCLWWRLPTVTLLKSAGSLMGGPNQVVEVVDSPIAYKMALDTWSKWVHNNIDSSKTKLFYMSHTAAHAWATDWGRKKGETCYGETEPLTDYRFWEIGTDPKILRILESSLSKLKAKGVNVQMINITQLTEARRDAHPSIYRKVWRPFTEDQKKNPHSISDCAHWCLPGVPDIWNELLLAYIFPTTAIAPQ